MVSPSFLDPTTPSRGLTPSNWSNLFCPLSIQFVVMLDGLGGLEGLVVLVGLDGASKVVCAHFSIPPMLILTGILVWVGGYVILQDMSNKVNAKITELCGTDFIACLNERTISENCSVTHPPLPSCPNDTIITSSLLRFSP